MAVVVLGVSAIRSHFHKKEPVNLGRSKVDTFDFSICDSGDMLLFEIFTIMKCQLAIKRKGNLTKMKM